MFFSLVSVMFLTSCLIMPTAPTKTGSTGDDGNNGGSGGPLVGKWYLKKMSTEMKNGGDWIEVNKQSFSESTTPAILHIKKDKITGYEMSGGKVVDEITESYSIKGDEVTINGESFKFEKQSDGFDFIYEDEDMDIRTISSYRKYSGSIPPQN